MIKPTTILISLLFIYNLTYGQDSEKEPEYHKVNWKVGTEKSVFQVDSTIIYNADTVFLSTVTNSNYKIKVVSLQDSVYEILFKHSVLDNNFSLKSESAMFTSVEGMMQLMLEELQNKMQDFEYSFLVDKNTAQAFEVKNEEELMLLIDNVVNLVVNNFLEFSKEEIDETKRMKLEAKIEELIAEKMPESIQTMLNAFNYIFQAYSFPYVLNETYRTDVEVYQVDQIQFGGVESKAGLVVNSSIRNSVLNIDYKYEYDKEVAYQDYIVAKGKEDQVSRDQFEMNERVVSEFDLKSSWITSSTSFVNAKMGDVVVNQITRIRIK